MHDDETRPSTSVFVGRSFRARHRGWRHYASSGIVAVAMHGMFLTAVLWTSSRLPRPPDGSMQVVPTTIVFRIEAGPGGGGGGGGEEDTVPPTVREVEGTDVAAHAVETAPVRLT